RAGSRATRRCSPNSTPASRSTRCTCDRLPPTRPHPPAQPCAGDPAADRGGDAGVGGDRVGGAAMITLGDLSPLVRKFLVAHEGVSGCWIWRNRKSPAGYGL